MSAANDNEAARLGKAEPVTRAAPRPCPICGKPAAATHAPFCSKRCADVDLHRWLGGAYAIPSDVEPPEQQN